MNVVSIRYMVVIGLIIAFAMGLYLNLKPPTGAVPAQRGALSTPVVIRALGYVEPQSEIRRLVFKFDGVIQECCVALGQRVSKGQVLMILKNQDETAAVAVAERELMVARAEKAQLAIGANPHRITSAEHKVALSEERVRHAKRHRDRYLKLFEQKAVSDQEMDRAESELIQAKAGLQQDEADLTYLNNYVLPEHLAVAEAKIQRADAQLQVAKERLEHSFLRSPSDGVVLEIMRREGEAQRVLDREPVMILANDLRLRVRAEVDERFVSMLKVSLPATVFGRGLGQKRYAGQVAFIKQLMGSKTVFARDASERIDLDVIQVFIGLPNDFRAPLGLQVEVAIHIQECNTSDGH